MAEQRARESIDRLLRQGGWIVQDRDQMSIGAGPGVAVREFSLATGFADDLLYADGKAIGVVEAKPQGHTFIGNGGFQEGRATFTSPNAKSSISGYVYKDSNQNQVKDSREAGLPVRVVFIDSDGDGRRDTNEKAVTTSATGHYRFSDLAAGTYSVREAVAASWAITRAAAGYYKIALPAGFAAKNKNFGSLWASLITADQVPAPRPASFSTVAAVIAADDDPLAG